MPTRRDIDPTEIPQLLPNVQMIDVIGNGARYRYRLIGTELVAAFGREYTGKFVDELLPPERRYSVELAGRMVCDTGSPVFLHNRYWTSRDTTIAANRVYAPLSDNGRDVSVLLSACVFGLRIFEIAGLWGLDAKIDPEHHLESVDLSTFAARVGG